MSAARTATSPDASAFGESRAGFEEIVGWLDSVATAAPADSMSSKLAMMQRANCGLGVSFTFSAPRYRHRSRKSRRKSAKQIIG